MFFHSTLCAPENVKDYELETFKETSSKGADSKPIFWKTKFIYFGLFGKSSMAFWRNGDGDSFLKLTLKVYRLDKYVIAVLFNINIVILFFSLKVC